MNFKYAGIYRDYVNCPSCEGADGFPKLKLFKSIRELCQFALENYGDGEISEIYSLKTGNELEDKIYISYSTYQHNVKEMTIKVKNLHLKTHKVNDKITLIKETEVSRILYR